jgi:hypothetical protein
MIRSARSLNLALAFLLELALLAAVAYWGSQLSASTAVRWIVAVGAPLSLAVIWSLIASPDANWRLPPTPLVAFKLLVFTLGAALLFASGQRALGIGLEAIALINLALSVAYNQV